MRPLAAFAAAFRGPSGPKRRRAVLAAMLALTTPVAAAAECAVALALALDISSSVNAQEYNIQKGGLAHALRDPVVRDVILSPPGSVALLAYEWSGWQQQNVIADWALIGSGADLDAFADQLDSHYRDYAEFSTAIGRALTFGADQFDRLPFPCARRIIDISGDGVNNEYHAPDDPRVRARLLGKTVNALVISGASPPPARYYRDHVIFGPGAFMMVARNGFKDYPELIKGKLLRELQQMLFIGEIRRTRVTR